MNKISRETSKKIGMRVFYVLILVTFFMVFGTIRSTSSHRTSGHNLLQQIQADTLAYRLSEVESVLSFEEKQKHGYIDRQLSVQHRLERKFRDIEQILITNEENAAYAVFVADWKAYVSKGNATLAVPNLDPNQQDVAAWSQTSRVLYEKMRQSLETLIEVNAKAPESWSGFIKIFTVENRLTLAFLYVCGLSAFLIFIFNLYDKFKRRKTL